MARGCSLPSLPLRGDPGEVLGFKSNTRTPCGPVLASLPRAGARSCLFSAVAVSAAFGRIACPRFLNGHCLPPSVGLFFWVPGYLVKGRLRCPWHGACFSTKTGDIEEYPTLDCLPVFQVRLNSACPPPLPKGECGVSEAFIQCSWGRGLLRQPLKDSLYWGRWMLLDPLR